MVTNTPGDMGRQVDKGQENTIKVLQDKEGNGCGKQEIRQILMAGEDIKEYKGTRQL